MDGPFKPSGELDVRHGVYVLGYVVATVGEVELSEELVTVVEAAAAVFRERVEVEGVVGGLREFAVFDDFAAEPGVEGLEDGGPVGVAMDLRVEEGDVLSRGESRVFSVVGRGGGWKSVEMAIRFVFVG